MVSYLSVPGKETLPPMPRSSVPLEIVKWTTRWSAEKLSDEEKGDQELLKSSLCRRNSHGPSNACALCLTNEKRKR